MRAQSAPEERGAGRRKFWRHGTALLPFSLALALLLWYLIARFAEVPAFILPTPDLVLFRFIETIQDGSLASHTLVTLQEVLAGLAIVIGILAFIYGTQTILAFQPPATISASIP